jgi:antitoxin YefM
MQILHASEARKNLHKLVDHVSEAHEPTFIKGKRNTAVLVSLEDWESIRETLYLSSIPGMMESIKEGINTSKEKCKTAEELGINFKDV